MFFRSIHPLGDFMVILLTSMSLLLEVKQGKMNVSGYKGSVVDIIIKTEVLISGRKLIV